MSSTPDPTIQNTAKIVMDQRFYFQDVTFLVENTLFKVPRRPFAEASEVFKDLFTLPPPPGEAPEGLSDEKPLRLDGIKAEDFRHLLYFMYPESNLTYIKGDEDSEKWISVLHLSKMWAMDDALAMAISRLESTIQDPIKKVILARQYEIPRWLAPALLDIVKSPRRLTQSDVDQLGLGTVLKLAALRESYPQRPITTTPPTCTGQLFPTGALCAFRCAYCGQQLAATPNSVITIGAIKTEFSLS